MSQLKSQRQADLCEFAANLVYIAGSRHQPVVHSETPPQKINTKINNDSKKSTEKQKELAGASKMTQRIKASTTDMAQWVKASTIEMAQWVEASTITMTQQVEASTISTTKPKSLSLNPWDSLSGRRELIPQVAL